MKTNNQDMTDVRALVRDVMNIDTAAFAALGARSGAGGNIKAGLHEFVRLILEQAIELLKAPNGHQVRLQTALGARASPTLPDKRTMQPTLRRFAKQ